jgi:hypothetical protein
MIDGSGKFGSMGNPFSISPEQRQMDQLSTIGIAKGNRYRLTGFEYLIALDPAQLLYV